MPAIATREATSDLVAATAVSGPAMTGTTRSAADPTGESGVLSSASVSAPPARAWSCRDTRSGLPPDCEMVTQTARSSDSRAS